MSRYCKICRNTSCDNCGKDITFLDDGWLCNYQPLPSNADHIRAMSDEELAKIIICPFDNDPDSCIPGASCLDCCLEWLQQPYESEETL